MRKQREKQTQKPDMPAGALRSRAAQKKGTITRRIDQGEQPEKGAVSRRELVEEEIPVGPEFLDSELPPPPQIRRARSTADPKKKAKDKNTGIKGRSADGTKHSPRARATSRSR